MPKTKRAPYNMFVMECDIISSLVLDMHNYPYIGYINQPE